MLIYPEKWQGKIEKFTNRCRAERQKLLAALDQPMAAQQSVLSDIIARAENTVFGREHNFNSIASIVDFQSALPIRSYEQLNSWLEMEIQQKGQALSGSRVIRWLKTSGSTGDPKKIPYSVHWMQTSRVPALYALWANYLCYAPEMLAQPYATMDISTVRENPSDFLNGIPYQGITNRNQLINEFDWDPPWYEAPWFTDTIPADYSLRMYYRLRHCIGKDLRTIVTINPSTLTALQHHLVKQLPQLVKDIFDGSTLGEHQFTPDPLLAKKLEQFVGREDITLTAIWPNLSLISCWTSASAKLYLPLLEKIYPNVSLLPFMSCGSEGITAIPIDLDPRAAPLAVSHGFYEFLPASVDLNQVIENEMRPHTLLFHDLEIGQEYHLIMTQGNGMCRYAVGDVYKVVDFYKSVPRIEFSYRKDTFFSFTGEKLTEAQIMKVMNGIAANHHLVDSIFLCYPVWEEVPYYKIMIETENVENFSNNLMQLEQNIDAMISTMNIEYRSKRESGRLANIKIFPVKRGSIDKFMQQEKLKKNSLQLKYNPFQKNDRMFNAILESLQ